LLLDPFIYDNIICNAANIKFPGGKKPSKGAKGRAILRELVEKSI
jgi:hypothetical protein